MSGCMRMGVSAVAALAVFLFTAAPGRSADPAPVLQFSPGGIGIVEAARTALQHDPDIKIQATNADFELGVAQEQKGAFDATLQSTVSYEYREQEQRQGRQQLERERREFLDEAIADGEQDRQDAQTLLNEIDAAASCTVAVCAAAGCPTVTLSDPEFNSMLVLLDAVIAQETVFGTRAALCTSRRDLLISSRDFGQIALDELVADQQERQDRLDALGDVPGDEIFYEARFDVTGTKPFRTGIVLETFLESSMSGEDFKDKSKAADEGGKGVEDLYVFRVGGGAVFPLLRGRGKDATGAFERAAQLEYDANMQLLRHQSSVSVLVVALTYWDLRATQELAEVAQESLDLQRQLVDATQALIGEGELAQVELARVQASRARSEARLDDANRQLHQARVLLADVMGVAATDDGAGLPLARDPFPQVVTGSPGESEVTALVADARQWRLDLAAALSFEQSGKMLVRGAETDTRPVLDASVRVWATALGEGGVGEAVDRWVGPSYHLQLDFEKPIGNNLLRGRLAQRQADLRQRGIEVMESDRQIALAIVRNAHSLADAAERVQQVQASVEYYQKTIDAEIERFSAGDSTLIDTILTEDQQTGARSELVLARQSYAKILAQLRFDTGRLVTHEGEQSIVAKENLVTVPYGTRPSR